MKDSTKRLLNCNGRLPQRIVLAIMLITAIANMFTMRNCLSVAIVRMTKPPPSQNKTTTSLQQAANLKIIQDNKEYDFDWTQKQQGYILSSFYYGYVFSHLPGGMIADRFGGKYTLLFGLGSTTITTLLTPVVTRIGGMIGLITLRVIMGIGEGVTFPALTVMLAKWVPHKESSRIGTAVLAASQLGTVLAASISGLLLGAWKWDYTFYFFGVCGFLWCLFWILLCYSVPADHPFISEKELAYLTETIAPKKRVQPVPWKSIACSVPVWGIIIGQLGHDWGFFMMIIYLPKYLNDVLHVSIRKNGFLAALPSLVMWMCSLIIGFLADHLIKRNKCSVLNIRRYLTLSAAVLPAIGLLSASLVGTSQLWAMVCFTLGMAGMAGYYPGMRVNPLDISRNYAGTVMAANNGLGASAGMVAPIVVGALTPHASVSEWRTVFIITFVVLVLSGILYFFMARATIQKWDLQEGETLPEAEDTKSKKRAKKDKEEGAQDKDIKDKDKQDTKGIDAKGVTKDIGGPSRPAPPSEQPPAPEKKSKWWWPF